MVLCETPATEAATWPLCQAITKAGAHCRGVPNATGFCPCHRENAREIQALGGRSKSRQAQLQKRLPEELRGVLNLLTESIKQCHSGELHPSRATAMAALASSLVRLGEYAELTGRLESLEKKLGKDKQLTWPRRSTGVDNGD